MEKTYSILTGLIVILATSISLAADTATEEKRDVASSDFSGAYLEQVNDEKAAENLRRQADSEEHDKYLKTMNRGSNR